VDTYSIIAISGLCFLLAGTVKGVVGIGLPTTAIAVMSLILDPRVAIAITLIPMIGSNAWQVFRMGEIRAAIRNYWVFAVILFCSVWITTYLSKDVPQAVLIGALGLIIIIFSLANLWKDIPKLPDSLDRMAQIIGGLLAGIMGGLTAVWGPPMVMYLTARRVPKDEFVRATGLLIFAGSIPLIAGYIANGFLTKDLAVISGLMLIPTFIGFTLGESIREKLGGEAFRKTLLLVFLVLGANLLRRAIF
jgi:uncharacterized membrane protein YfcA